MKRKIIAAVLSVVFLSAILGDAVAYADADALDTISGRAAITIVEPDPPPPPPPPSRPQPTRPGNDGSTTTIPDASAPLVPLDEIVTILDPEIPLAELPDLPLTGENRAVTTLAVILVAGGASIVLRAGASRRKITSYSHTS